MVRIINVCSGKGGVGKTTITANLGVAMQNIGKRVAVVDFNITTSHLGLYFDMHMSPVTLNDFLRNQAKLEEAVYTHPSGLKIVPASLKLSDIVDVNTSALRETLRSVFCNCDIVLLDSAPGLGREAMIAFQSCDEVLFVANPFVPSMADIEKCKQVIYSLESKPAVLGVIANRVRNRSYELTLEEMSQFLEMPVVGVVPEDENVLASFNTKSLVVMTNKKTPASKAFLKIASNMAGVQYKEGFWERFRHIFRKEKDLG